ncbi:MAG: PilT/PilU family type 4a pilus ATPase [Azoarcus sp.]|jgi:twitching motility protein PilT|nr:PilT/PilU family type 4a pilus ATPase [Azoarcus sp.]
MKTSVLSVFNALLERLPKADASDLHLVAGLPPRWRIHGELEMCEGRIWHTPEMACLAETLLSEVRTKMLAETGSADLGHSAGGHRFRIHFFRSMGRLALVARYLPDRYASFSELLLPPEIRELAWLPFGLVLVTGVTGSGKSTTLASITHEINANQTRHIITIEDPVEFVHHSIKGLVSHRELGQDTPDFATAVRASLREDPDVILVGELRDTETMRAALTAAETGHLVFSTLHTGDATGAAERFLGAFPGEEQAMARHRLALVLKAVVAQQLLPRADKAGRAPAVEILRGTPAVLNLIASNRTSQLYSAMESGSSLGMKTYDQSMAELVRKGIVAMETARPLSRNPEGFALLAQKESSPENAHERRK